MPNEYKITLTNSPDSEDVKVVSDGLDNYNVAMGAPDNWLSLAVFIRDTNNKILGGLTGGTYWGWLYVGRLWLDDTIRGHGFGSQLLAQAEAEAQRRGCYHAFLDTTSFQALPFYQKQGYVLYGQLDDFPAGHSRYFLRKNLASTLTN
jgi:GNAT superfamily N-acetyltransferase